MKIVVTGGNGYIGQHLIKELLNHDIEVICADSGVVIIPQEKINDEFYKRLEFIEEQEDI